jgi:2-phosphoglycerate kinase
MMMLVVNLDEKSWEGRFAGRRRSPHHQPHDYLENLGAILRIQEHLLDLAEEVDDVPVVNNEDFEQSVRTVLRHVSKTLRDRHGFDAAELL